MVELGFMILCSLGKQYLDGLVTVCIETQRFRVTAGSDPRGARFVKSNERAIRRTAMVVTVRRLTA